MSQNNTGKAGVIFAPRDGNGMDKLASSILDDLLYNVIHDLVMKTHRDEKQARAATAAIRVETMAAEAAQDLAGATGEAKPEGHYETEAASYESGRVTLKGNPLDTTHDILCPRCHLPRLLYPTDGIGARKPDPSLTYCKKHPYINKPGCDIYGQMWVAPGPGRGKKKKDFEKKITAAINAATTGIESADGSGGSSAEQRPPNVMSFPSATCSKCKRCILVSRLNNHMGSCIGNSGRNASRAAAQRISNGGNGHGHGHGNGHHNGTDHTPPSSQKGTPLPSSQGSPRKRDAEDFDDDGYDDADRSSHGHATAKPKKKIKVSSASAAAAATNGTTTPSSSQGQGLSLSLTKKLTLKVKHGAGGPKKTKKTKASSALSFGRKISDNYDDDDDDDGDGDGEGADGDFDVDDDDDNDDNYAEEDYGHGGGVGRGGDDSDLDDDGDDDDDDDDDGRARSTSSSIHYRGAGSVPKTKKKKQQQSLLGAAAAAGSLKKTLLKGASGAGNKKMRLMSKTPLSPPASKNGRVRDMDAGSESSGTMSSPQRA